jgi:hypothetical protein
MALLAGLPFIALWIAGVIHVNRTYAELVAPAVEAARSWGAQQLNVTNGAAFALISHSGEALFIKPPQRLIFNMLFVTDAFVGIAEGFTFDFAARRCLVGRGAKELYYQHINTVEFRPPHFSLQTSSGEVLQYESTSTLGQPEGAVTAVRNRLRALQARRE